MNKQDPDISPYNTANDEIDLVDLFLIIWKRKWMIVAVTVLLTVAAAGISMIMPKVYEVSAILEPAKDADGKLVENPQTIRENIIGGAYDRIIAENLGLNLDKFPDFKVSVPKNTDLVKIEIESSEPDNAVAILDDLLVHITEGITAQLDIKKKLIQNKLQTAEAEKKLFPEQIKKLENLIAKTEKKIPELEASRDKSMSTSDSDPMVVLLYLNEIQNRQLFLNGLYSQLAQLNSGEEMAEARVRDMRLNLSAVKGTSINKPPGVSENPIRPKKALIVALAFILGLMGAIMLAFLAEFMNKVRQQQAKEGYKSRSKIS